MHKPLPNVAADWQGDVINPEVLNDQAGVASLQLLIMYGTASCNHTATRFYCPDKGAFFWDPGGGYGTKGYVQVDRAEDIIVRNIPSLNDYLYWRTKVPTQFTEIFIWEGNNDLICDIYDLMEAASKKERQSEFKSNANGMFCTFATTDFLGNYAQDLMQVKKWGLPHNLSKQLHQQQSADKIYIVDHNTNLIKQYYPK